MAIVTNIEETTANVVLDEGLWMGSDNSSTAWLSGIAGVSAGQAEGGVKMMILDVICTSSGATSFNLTSTGITGVSGTRGLAILSVSNMAGGFEVPVAWYLSGTNNVVINFTAHGSAAGDTHRLVFLYA